MKLFSEHNTSGLSPHIIIYNNVWDKQLEYVHENINPQGIRDFTLKSWKLSGGINDDVGTCTIEIEDKNAEHTLQIKPDWIVRIYLYREQEHLWFTGIVVETALFRLGSDQQKINVTAYGYGHTLTQRYVNISKKEYEIIQGTTPQGITNTTEDVSISELVRFVLHDKAMLIPPADKNIPLDIEDIPILFKEFNEECVSQDIILEQLANITDAVYGVTPDLNFYFRLTKPQSDFIVTNKNQENQDPATLYIIRNQPYTITDSSQKKATDVIGRHISILDDTIPDNKGQKNVFVDIKAQNTTLKKINRSSETKVYLPGTLDRDNATKLIDIILNRVSKTRRTYNSLVVSANNNAPPLGKRVRFIDSNHNNDTTPICMGYDISADDKSKLEATDMKLTLEELV